MENYVLSCCSTADLTKEHFTRRDIHYVCFHFSLDGRQYTDDLGESISYADFYAAMERGADTKTSQVNVEEFISHFEPFLKSGRDVLHLTLSSGISGVHNSAQAAAAMLREKYPQRKLYIVDSLGASSGYGLLMDTLADLRDGGMGIDALRGWALDHRITLHHWFFSTDLTFYVKGGRISKAAGWFGTALKICPLLNMDDTGHLRPRFKIRGKGKVTREIVSKMEKYAEGGLDYSGKCYICHSACYEDARRVADLVEEKFKKLNGKPEIYNIGTTIGAHTGPGTVAMFFFGDRREE